MNPGRRSIMIGVAFICVWALLIVSCGERTQSYSEYEHDLRSIMDELEEEWAATNSTREGTGNQAQLSTTQIVDKHRRTQLSLRDVANRLDELRPPPKLRADHDALVTGTRGMADAIDILIKAEQVAPTDPRRSARLARQFATDDSFESVLAAASNIDKAGIDVDL